MYINWNLDDVIKEINRVKELKPKNFNEKASKYLQLETLEKILFTRCANDHKLYQEKSIENSLEETKKYLNTNKSLNKNINKKIYKSTKEALLEFMLATKNHSLSNTEIDLENPLVEEYINKLSVKDIINIGDDFFNTIPFLEKEVISKSVDKGLVNLTSDDKTIYTANVGKIYPTGHILATYKDNIYLNSLINIISSYAHSVNLEKEPNYFMKKLKVDNIFIMFFPKLMELLSYDFILEKHDDFAGDVNLSKFKFLNQYNNNLKDTLSLIKNPQERLPENIIKIPKELTIQKNINEKEYYNFIIESLETDLSTPMLISKLKVLKEKIKDPISFIPPIFGDEMSHKYPLTKFADDILNSGTRLLGTLLALKFHYLIKEDSEKGFKLLEQVYYDLIINNKDSSIVLKQYGLEDYFSPDYIEQYNQDYKKDNSKKI